jgi:hypothetical protein
MSLVSYADFMKPAYSQPTSKVHELTKQRLNDKAKPMPPGGEIAPEDLSALNAWLSDGAKAANPTEVACSDGTGGIDQPTSHSMEPLVALPGETCYEFKNHGGQDRVDDTLYEIGPGEHYTSFYFNAPWPNDTVASRYGARFDNLRVLHHWLAFETDETNPEGSWVVSPLPTVNGVGANLIAGWAVGGTNIELPEDVGFELPPHGKQINMQWHFYNSTPEMQTDKSAVQICTVPKAARAHTASITWVGTEDLNGNKWLGGAGMPPRQESEFEGTCNPLRAGMDPTEPIHIIGFWPHMHQLGTNMQTFINHKDGTKEKIFDKPFDFNKQVHYLHPYELQPGDTITARCRFNNTTDFGVAYGESSDTEMCYNFTFAWPAHALDNGVPSLIGATNTCW